MASSNLLAQKGLTRKGRGLLLAYDHGFEHGPVDFDGQSIDPTFIMEIADSGFFTGVVLQKGVAEKYYDPQKHQVPLILKLNGKTAFHKDEEPYSPQICSVAEAADLGAAAVGYTIYVASEKETDMMKEFSQIEEQAHDKNLAVIGWMYPRGSHVPDDTDPQVLAYAARLGLELGADAIKIKYTGDPESFSWVVQAAGRTQVFVVGGSKTSQGQLIQQTQEILSVGAAGWAIGRNIWQAKHPLAIAERLATLVYSHPVPDS